MNRNDEFRDWMLENEDNPELDIVMRKILDASASDDQYLEEEGFAEFKAKTGVHRPEYWKKIGYYAVRTAACLFLPLLLMCIWATHRAFNAEQEWVKVCTSIAQTENVILPDGTEIRLSPCSQIFYPAAGYLKDMSGLQDGGKTVRLWAANLTATPAAKTNMAGNSLLGTLATSTFKVKEASRAGFALPIRCMKQ